MIEVSPRQARRIVAKPSFWLRLTLVSFSFGAIGEVIGMAIRGDAFEPLVAVRIGLLFLLVVGLTLVLLARRTH